MNKVILVGNLGTDPEARYSQAGNMVVNFRLATNSYYKGETKAEWHNIVVFGQAAEFVKENMTKGNSASLDGELRTRSWEDKEGNRRYTTEVVVHRISFGPSTGHSKEDRSGHDEEEFDFPSGSNSASGTKKRGKRKTKTSMVFDD